ncbi:unnamed protein product [Lymnaea stagnalis]|uniref:Uncharacterized protein n=1 Tax=Lymnaea stagnalis TaxID=6523 RepID=A0AAV2IBB8_LYMST
MDDSRNWRSDEGNDNNRKFDRYEGSRSSRRSRDDRNNRKSRDDDYDDSRSNRRARSRSGSPSERRRNRKREERESRKDSDDSDDGSYSYSNRIGMHDYDSRNSRRNDRSRSREEDVQHTGNERITGHDWRSKLTSIRDAHFNRSKQAPTMAQNQFKNDGSFLEMFKKKMAEQTTSSVTPNSLVLASSSIPFSAELSLPPLTTMPLDEPHTSSTANADQDLDGVPMPTHKSLPVPVSVGKRRLAKPLKTGIVLKKPQEPVEDEVSQEKLDAWARYLQEVQKYKSSNCMDEDNSRPLVK